MSSRLLAALAAFALILCRDAACAATARSGQPVMGTILTVTVSSGSESEAKLLADAAIEEARRWDDALTIWREDGELARFNLRAGSGNVAVSSRLHRGLAAMLELARASGGAFDPAIGSLRAVPKPARTGVRGVANVLQLGSADASLARGSVLDPGGIGKGLALDAIVEMLKSRHVVSAFLDFGGSSQTAIGAPPDDPRGWAVLVSGWEPGTSHGIVRLRDASLSTSRASAVDTTPIVDPRSGKDVAAPRLATVLAPTATAADAWSTALVVLGKDGLAAAAAHGVEGIFEDKDGASRSKGFPADE